MNVCALDVVTRAADFETVAATLEFRGWEWDFLHDVDGEATLGAIAHRTGIDLDSAIGFVHEAMHRGLISIPTMTLDTYRLRIPTQTALRTSSPALSLGTSAVAEPAPSTGAISFSSDAFDWNAPEPSFDEPEDAPDFAVAHEAPGGVHYDDRFGVEHPGGPFAATHQHDAPFSIESHHEDDPFAIASHPEDAFVAPPSEHHELPFAVTAGHDVEPLVAHLDDPFAVAEHHDEPVAEVVHHDVQPFAPPFAEAPHALDDPFAVTSHHEDPFGAEPSQNGHAHTNGTSLNGHSPVRFDELFADVAPTAAAHEEPLDVSTNGASTNGHATYEYVSDNHVAADRFAEAHVAEEATPAAMESHFIESHFDDVHDVVATHEAPIESFFADPHVAETHVAEPQAVDTHVATEHVTYAQHEEAPAHDETPGSISFSFSADDPAGAHETYDVPSDRESPEVWTPPVAPIAHVAEPATPVPEPIKAQAMPDVVEKAEPAADPRVGQTQSLYFEREAIDTDAGRELEAKVKNWKESLSWREQQELNEASASGTEKAGVIGSLLRAPWRSITPRPWNPRTPTARHLPGRFVG